MSTEGSTRAIIAALIANLGIALSKVGAFVITGSSSMLAEAVHSFADTGNQLLLLMGGKRSRRAPDAEHPFGFGRERYFWAFVVSIILFTLGSLFAIFEGEEKIRHPHEIESPAVALGVLVIAMALEAFSFRTAVREAQPYRGSATWPQFIRRAKVPELPVVLLEDAGALVGLTLAFIAVCLALVTGDPIWDGFGTLAIGLLLGAIAITLSIEMKSLLIGEAADPDEEAKLIAAIEAFPLVRALIFMRTQHFGPEQLLVTVKVEFDGDLTMAELAQAIDDLEVEIRGAVPSAHYLFIEPDIRRAVANTPVTVGEAEAIEEAVE
jgi:cation diffusion facilitator family transporter